MAGYVVAEAMKRAGIDPAEVEDVVIGSGLPEGATGNNIGRTAALRAGCPVTVSGGTVSRFCASGLDAIAAASKRVIVDNADVVVGGGVESISMVQNYINTEFYTEEWLLRHTPDVYMPMLYTADNVAKKYNVSRESQDEYALQSQQRTAEGQKAGRFDKEIVQLPSWKFNQDKDTGKVTEEHVNLKHDEGNRADTTLEGLSSLKGAVPGIKDTSVRCLPCRNFSSSMASRSMTSDCGSSTRRSRFKPCTAATRWAFPTTVSTSTAARFRSATRTG